MKVKTPLAGLVGLVVGVAGYYVVGRAPSVVQHVVQPTTPSNVALMFGQDVSANVSYAAKSLMTPPTRRQFTQADWRTLRQWVGKTGEDGFATYEVLTFPNHRSLALWLTTPIGGPSNNWEVQQIQEGTNLRLSVSSAWVGVAAADHNRGGAGRSPRKGLAQLPLERHLSIELNHGLLTAHVRVDHSPTLVSQPLSLNAAINQPTTHYGILQGPGWTLVFGAKAGQSTAVFDVNGYPTLQFPPPPTPTIKRAYVLWAYFLRGHVIRPVVRLGN